MCRGPAEPLHVRRDKGGAWAKGGWIRLCWPATLAIRPGIGVNLRLVREHQSMLLEAWHEFFGMADGVETCSRFRGLKDRLRGVANYGTAA
jgi:hypothetical protein